MGDLILFHYIWIAIWYSYDMQIANALFHTRSTSFLANNAVFKISAGLRTLTGKIWVGPASFPFLSYVNLDKIVLWSCKFQILFWRLIMYFLPINTLSPEQMVAFLLSARLFVIYFMLISLTKKKYNCFILINIINVILMACLILCRYVQYHVSHLENNFIVFKNCIGLSYLAYQKVLSEWHRYIDGLVRDCSNSITNSYCSLLQSHWYVSYCLNWFLLRKKETLPHFYKCHLIVPMDHQVKIPKW